MSYNLLVCFPRILFPFFENAIEDLFFYFDLLIQLYKLRNLLNSFVYIEIPYMPLLFTTFSSWVIHDHSMLSRFDEASKHKESVHVIIT